MVPFCRNFELNIVSLGLLVKDILDHNIIDRITTL